MESKEEEEELIIFSNMQTKKNLISFLLWDVEATQANKNKILHQHLSKYYIFYKQIPSKHHHHMRAAALFPEGTSNNNTIYNIGWMLQVFVYKSTLPRIRMQ